MATKNANALEEQQELAAWVMLESTNGTLKEHKDGIKATYTGQCFMCFKKFKIELDLDHVKPIKCPNCDFNISQYSLQEAEQTLNIRKRNGDHH